MKLQMVNVTRKFGNFRAVENLNLTIENGVYGLLGVNGAGKTTLMRMICTLLPPTSGQILCDGKDIFKMDGEYRNLLGYLPQEFGFYPDFTVKDYLLYIASLKGIRPMVAGKRVKDLLAQVGLTKSANKKMKKLSGGMKRRAGIAQAMLNNPKILILDEPTTGLDPQTRNLLWRVIGELRKNEELTVFLTTHYMEEAADADYVVILDSGKISACGTPIELKNKYTGDFITLYGANENEVSELSYPYEKIGDAYRVAVPDTAAATALIVKRPEIFRDYEITKGKMDDVFLTVTGKKLTGDENK